MFFIILFTILSALGSALIYIFTGLYANLAFLIWFPIVVFLGLWLIQFILLCLWIIVSSWFINVKKPQDMPNLYCQWILSQAGDVIKFLLRTPVIMKKEDRKFFKELRKSKIPHIIVANHTSNLDQFLFWSLFKGMPVVALSKPEIQKIPVIGKYSYRAGNISINRDNPMQALRGISKSVNFLKENPTTSLSMFPEGTRSKTGELGPFHATTFIIPEKTKLPIILITIQNADKMKHRLLLWTKIYIDVVKEISKEEVEKMSTQEMSDLSRQLIYEHLEQNKYRLYKTK